MKSKFEKSKNGNSNQHSGRSDNKEEHRFEPNKERFCTYCHKKNHSKEECFKLKKKKDSERKSQPSQPSTAATVSAVKRQISTQTILSQWLRQLIIELF
ncbi:unnamed protein product [Lasius platythorax]|uniref:Uncharacterized protein n=1 Tax=Lasius platythorax TaxID=488582 RepID=A0AAV2N048_9HYME